MMRADVELQRQVLEELRYDPQVRGVYTGAAVLTSNGIVTLSGQVRSYAQKIAAEEAVLSLRGVRRTVNDLEVIPAHDENRSDPAIEAALQVVLSWNSMLAGTDILATVERGWVFLGGTVCCAYQKEIAERAAGQLAGVRGITNGIAIQAKPAELENMKSRIMYALGRNALVDRLRIDVIVSGDEVILRGRAKSWAECQEVSRIAWSSPGVRTVDNQLTVDGDGPI